MTADDITSRLYQLEWSAEKPFPDAPLFAEYELPDYRYLYYIYTDYSRYWAEVFIDISQLMPRPKGKGRIAPTICKRASQECPSLADALGWCHEYYQQTALALISNSIYLDK